MKKILLICSCILSPFFNYSQNIELSLQQDARLLFIGDGKNNSAITLNILTKVEIPIIKLKNNYIAVYPSIEYADLTGGNFQRYAIGGSYHLNTIYRIIKQVQTSFLAKVLRFLLIPFVAKVRIIDK